MSSHTFEFKTISQKERKFHTVHYLTVLNLSPCKIYLYRKPETPQIFARRILSAGSKNARLFLAPEYGTAAHNAQNRSRKSRFSRFLTEKALSSRIRTSAKIRAFETPGIRPWRPGAASGQIWGERRYASAKRRYF